MGNIGDEYTEGSIAGAGIFTGLMAELAVTGLFAGGRALANRIENFVREWGGGEDLPADEYIHYFKRWREKVLTATEINNSQVLSRLEIIKNHDALVFNDVSGGNIVIDRGSEIQFVEGEIEIALELLKIKGWKSIVIEGSEDFVGKMMKAAIESGISIHPTNDEQKQMLANLLKERNSWGNKAGAALRTKTKVPGL